MRGPRFHLSVVCGISVSFPTLSPTTGQIPMHSSPVRHSPPTPCGAVLPFDLHVLGMPPAFNLSQDQTLRFSLLDPKVNSHEAFTPTSSRSSLNHLGWTLASMDSSSTRKAPTQVTCAHCQRSTSHRASPRPSAEPFAQPSRTFYIRFLHRQHLKLPRNHLEVRVGMRAVVVRVGEHSAAVTGMGSPGDHENAQQQRAASS